MEGTIEPHAVREIVLDRRRLLRMRSDMVLELMTSPPSSRRLLLGAVLVGVVAAATGGWPWSFAAVGWSLLVTLWWWLRAGRALRPGLRVGQRVSAGRGPDGEWRFTAETGSVGVARGAAQAVARWRGNVSVFTTSVSFVLPGELVSDEDAVFVLEASDPAAAVAGSSEVLVDAETQRRLVRAATRVVVTSADFAVPALTALVAFAAVAVLGSPTAVAVGAVVCTGGAAAGLEGVFTSRRTVGMAYLPGRQWRLETRSDGFAVTSGGVTRTYRWTDFRSRRIEAHVVMLRPRRRPLCRTVTELLPADLFDADARLRLTTHVPRRF